MKDEIIDYLKRELIGPDPTGIFIQENGEEILTSSPKDRYSIGILYPQGSKVDTATKEDDNEPEPEIASESQDDLPEKYVHVDGGYVDDGDANEEVMNLTNEYYPSAMGFSCSIDAVHGKYKVEVCTAKYKKGILNEEQGKASRKKDGYFRIPILWNRELVGTDFPEPGKMMTFNVQLEDGDTGLKLCVMNRTVVNGDNHSVPVYTLCLVNTNDDPNNVGLYYFQCGLSLSSVNPDVSFGDYPENNCHHTDDQKTSALLYRHLKTYAVGHGCSPIWHPNDKGMVDKIDSQSIPIAEIKPVVPRVFSDISLRMDNFLSGENPSITLKPLVDLTEKYRIWINEMKIQSESLDGESRITATRHIAGCLSCLNRMEKGIAFLKTDETALYAFRLMNKAMLMQQIHYSMKLREWHTDGDGRPVIDKVVMPDINDRSTWPDWVETERKNTRLGSWYPFQIAFILMNISSFVDPQDESREIVDLIWFPTGGGKTEAYLGLSAFSIFMRRLKNPSDDGTSVLMRYTLRLLTAQQFQRAASLLAACDLIRSEEPSKLGRARISIGLWAGNDLCPNTREDAKYAFREMSSGRNPKNPFVIYQCPWCGAQMGLIRQGKHTRVMGYRILGNTVVFRCDDSSCIFSGNNTLPVMVIDEDIYDNPPSLILGTVDKFAMLTWKPEKIRKIFGFRGSTRIDPPDLIIQDELHLISGPLGSIVGCYETLIDQLCRIRKTEKGYGAKIVASTATVSRAKEQILALYNRKTDDVMVFPQQALKAGESFFAFTDDKKIGRTYIGIHAAGLSHPTIHVRTVSSLIQAVGSIKADKNIKDYYWTLVDYFNSLRELGYAATRVHADIREYMRAMWQRKGLSGKTGIDERRHIRRVVELTSRIDSALIPRSLKDLEIKYTGDLKSPDAIDVCLATNMISVGVDVSRLGLMNVTGQPKMVSEYIQATSRVGRSQDGPGLVVVVYNPMKPRDRSYYEHFQSFHSKIYSYVEPTSITPFSVRVMERMLHSVIIGLVRYFGTDLERDSPGEYVGSELRGDIRNIIRERCEHIDPEATEQALRVVDSVFERWNRLTPQKYSDYKEPWNGTLIYPSSLNPPSDAEFRGWPTQQSMRNVDSECQMKIIPNYNDTES
jgi:hypothetical protein